MLSSSSLNLAYIPIGLIMVLLLALAPVVVLSDNGTNLRTTSTSTTVEQNNYHHRQLRATEVMYLNIMEVYETPELNTAFRIFYEVKARVRIVEKSDTGLVRGNIIRFVTYVNRAQGLGSPIVVVEDRCLYAQLTVENGKYVLAEGNDSLQYFPRNTCYVPLVDWANLLQLILSIFFPVK